MEKTVISIFENPIIAGLISITISVLTAYFTSVITTKKALKKSLAETLQKEKVGKVLNELSEWAGIFMLTPTPDNAAKGMDITDFIENKYEKFNSWITMNFANMNVVDEQLVRQSCSLRDELNKYIFGGYQMKIEEIEKQYKIVLDKVSELIKVLSQVQERIMKL